MRLRILALGLLLAVGFGAAGYVVFVAPTAGASSSQQYLTATASRTNVVAQAAATGSVSPSALYGLAFGRAAEIIDQAGSGSSATGSWSVAKLNASVGQSVKQGDVLAIADDSDAKATEQAAEAALQSAQQKLADDQAKPTSDDRASAQNALQQSQQSLADDQQNQADTKKQNDLSLANSRDAYREALKQLKDDRAAGYGSTTRQADRDAIAAAHQSLLNTEAQVTASNHQADQRVSSALLSLAAAQQTYATAIEPTDSATIAGDQAAVTQAQQTLDTAKAALAAVTLSAPADGVVTAINIAPGADAPSGDAIELQSATLEVTAAVTETDLPSIAVGQAASVTVSAASATLDGTVKQIAPTSDSSSGSVVTYTVTISLANVAAAVKSGMSANVSITTASASNVVAVPAIALVGSSGNYSVRTVTGQVVQTVPVQVGLVTSTLAEITSGLDEGASVVVGTSTTRTGTSSTSNGLGGGFGAFPGGGTFVRGGR